MTRFTAPKLDLSLLGAVVSNHLVPKCAMQVTRTGEMGPFQGRGPTDFRCECNFENAVSGSTRCTSCRSSSDCPADRQACNYGYCEVH